jgi:hypothetical protein
MTENEFMMIRLKKLGVVKIFSSLISPLKKGNHNNVTTMMNKDLILYILRDLDELYKLISLLFCHDVWFSHYMNVDMAII